MACGVPPFGNPLDCVGNVAKSAASDVFTAMAHDFAKAADATINWLWAQLSTATAVHLGGQAFDQLMGIVLAIAGVAAVGIFAIQLTVSAVRRDPGGLGRAAGGLVLMGLGTGAAVVVTEALLHAVDALCAGVLAVTTGGTEQQLGNDILSGGVITGFTTNPAGLMLVSLFALVASVMVWVALVVRKLLVIVAAVMAPFAFAGCLADFSRSWARRWVELVAALIFSKLIMVLIFVVGLYVLIRGVGSTGPGVTQTATNTACGILILTLAAFAPWMAVRLAHFAGVHLESVHQHTSVATHGAQRAVSMARPIMSGASGAPAGAAAGAGASGGKPSGGPPANPGSGNGKGSHDSPPSTPSSPSTPSAPRPATPTPPAEPAPRAPAPVVEDSPLVHATSRAYFATPAPAEPEPARGQANVRDGSALMHALDRAPSSPKGDL